MQIVELIVDCVTAGFSAPGVHVGSGPENMPEPIEWQEPGRGWGWTTVELACETGSEPGRVEGMGLWAGRRRRLGRAARRWPAVEVGPAVLVELVDDEKL